MKKVYYKVPMLRRTDTPPDIETVWGWEFDYHGIKLAVRRVYKKWWQVDEVSTGCVVKRGTYEHTTREAMIEFTITFLDNMEGGLDHIKETIDKTPKLN